MERPDAAAGSSTGGESAGRVDMHPPYERGPGDEDGPEGRSIATWLVTAAALIVMVLALLLIFHNAFRIG